MNWFYRLLALRSEGRFRCALWSDRQPFLSAIILLTFPLVSIVFFGLLTNILYQYFGRLIILDVLLWIGIMFTLLIAPFTFSLGTRAFFKTLGKVDPRSERYFETCIKKEVRVDD